MRPSIALGLKSLVSRIHPPLPLNPRESQKLLELLTASFRNQLELQHPNNGSKRPYPADAHIHSILSSPLLKGRYSKENSGGNTHGKIRPPNVLGQAQSSLLMPMEFFHDQVAAGKATIDTAKNCLAVQLENINNYKEVLATGQSSSDSKVLPGILHWLWSSGLEDSMEFIHDRRFVRLLMEFVILENEQKLFWQWLSRAAIVIHEHEILWRKTDDDLVTSTACLIRAFLHTNLKMGSNLNTAVSNLLKISGSLDKTSTSRCKKLLWLPSTYLSKILMDRSSQTTLDVALYNQLIELARLWNNGQSIVSIRLYLSHPTNPEPSLALQYIRTVLETAPKPNLTSRTKFVSLCLVTAKVLLENGSHKDASWMINVIKHNFADEVGEPRQIHRRSSPDKQPVDLGSLEALATI